MAIGLAACPVAADAKDKPVKYDQYEYGYQPVRKTKFRTPDGCEVEQEWKKGRYEEKIKCKPGRYG
jgi:hypothetical protein